MTERSEGIKRQQSIETRLVHAGTEPHQQHGYVNPPIYRGSTVLYDGVEAMNASQADPLKRSLPAYGRFGSPTDRAFEAAVSELEGGHAAIVACSGLAAITTAILSFVRAGDHILVSDSVYLPTRRFCDSLAALGVVTEYYDPRVAAAIDGLVRPETRLVYLESPGSMTFEMQDVPAITSVCRRRGIATIIDNTWATPLFFQPLKLGADVVVHSATKYLTGHADSILGVIVCTEDSYPTVRGAAMRLGQCAGGEDVYLGLRGLRTLDVRMRHHHRQAAELARWLELRDEVVDVMYPALPHDPGYPLWRRDFSGAAGVFGLVLDPRFGKPSVDAMLSRLRVFGLGHSWGGCESLIVPSEVDAHRLARRGTSGIPLRVHVGFENIDDLKEDLTAALLELKAFTKLRGSTPRVRASVPV
jgi:cystathionine beta-lyase